MTTPTVFWPAVLGVGFLVAGIITYWRDRRERSTRGAFSLAAFGPAFVAASLAAFAGEHFTLEPTIAQLVPTFLPARLAIAYVVGVAHLAAALSFVARRYVRWSSICLAGMFALFVLLMDLPAAIAHPSSRIAWILAARETTFSIGALALFAIATRQRWPHAARVMATIARFWTAGVLVFYGVDHLLHPSLTPGVPSETPIAAWVPLPHGVVALTGALLIAFGIAMLVARSAGAAAARCGELMTLLTVVLYVPQFFIARGVGAQVTAINFIFDTLLFAGMMLVISTAIVENASPPNALPGDVTGRGLGTSAAGRSDSGSGDRVMFVHDRPLAAQLA